MINQRMEPTLLFNNRHLIIAFTAMFWIVPVFSSEPVNIEINAKQLGPALKAFSTQTDFEVAIDPSFTTMKARPLTGEFLPEEALSLLLAPSGLTFERTGDRTFKIRQRGVDEAVTVSAASLDMAYRATVGSTATKTDALLSEVPQAIQVVPKVLMGDQQVRRLGDALENVSSVQDRGTFLGAYEQFAVRGFILDNLTNYYRDGRKYSNLIAPSTEVLERVEVLKGPGSVLFGQADPGGIVNFVTQQPPRRRDMAFKMTGGDESLQAYEANLGGAISDKLFYRVVGATEDRESFRDLVEADRRVLYGSLRWEMTRAVSMTFHFDDLQSDTVADSGLVAFGNGVVDQPLSTNYNEPWARYDTENSNVGYRLTALLNDSWQIRHSYNSQRLNRVRIDAQPVLIDEQQGFVVRRARQRDQDYDNDFFDVQLIGDLETGAIRHTLMFGAEYVESVNDSSETQNVNLVISLFDPVHGVDKPDFVPRTTNDNESNTMAYYFQDQLEIGEKFDFIVGLRYDDYDAEILAELTPRGDTISVAQAEEDALTYRFGAVWQASEQASLYASYSEGFAPNLDTRALPPSFLDPEESTQYEIGAKLTSSNNRFSYNLALFDLEKSNVLRFDPVLDRSVLIGVQAHQGFELDATGELLPGWSLTASYAYLDAEIEEDLVNEGNTPQNVAEQSGALWTSYKFQEGSLAGLRLSLGLRSVGSRFGDDAESFVLPSYERWNFGAGYRLQTGRGQLGFNLKVENLTDEDYYLGAISRTQITPGEPRQFLGSIDFTF